MAARIPSSFAASLAAVLWLAAPTVAGAAAFRVADPGQQNLGGDPQAVQDAMSDSQAFSFVAGQILGAAAACKQIDRNRVTAATQKAVIIVRQSAENQADVTAAQQYMLAAADSARDAVKNGTADCNRVSASFSKLEQVEQNAQEQQSQLDDPDQPAQPDAQDNPGGPDDAQ
jgi:hypothetical protein